MFDDSDHVEVSFNDIVDVNNYAETNSYMFVGKQLRKYELGVPMGDPLSCAAALSCTMAAEMTAKVDAMTANQELIMEQLRSMAQQKADPYLY